MTSNGGSLTSMLQYVYCITKQQTHSCVVYINLTKVLRFSHDSEFWIQVLGEIYLTLHITSL